MGANDSNISASKQATLASNHRTTPEDLTDAQIRPVLADQVATISARGRASNIPVELITDKLHEHSGNVDLVAKDLDIIYFDLARYIDRRPDLRLLTVTYREQMVDQAETNLRQDLANGDQKATFMVLRTLGRERGYVERREQEITTTTHEATAGVDVSTLSMEQLMQLRDIVASDKAKVIDADAVTVPDTDT